MPQAPRNSGPEGLGFAREGFRSLIDLQFTPSDLRVGACFVNERAFALHSAITDAVRTIVAMPANFIRFPSADLPVFTAVKARAGKASAVLELDVDALWAWGSLRVPGYVWRTMSRLGSWIEPVLVSEWARLIKAYAERMGLVVPAGQVEAALSCVEPVRNTLIGRDAARKALDRGEVLECCWSAKKLDPAQLDIDHCLPWAAWPCGDLWNLVPADRRVNQNQKRDRLPSRSKLSEAQPRIAAWWERAWIADPALAVRFRREAVAALPVHDPTNLDEIFDGLAWRRLRLQQDQQVPEWNT